MSIRPTIMKFGGTSVEDAAAVRNVAATVRLALNSRPVVVVSALGGFTNALLRSVETSINGDARGASKSLETEFERHLKAAEQLLNNERRAAFVSAVGDARSKIRQLHKIIAAHPVTSPPLQDEIVAYGEHLSSQLLTAALCEAGVNARHVDARCCIKTDDVYGAATPQPETTESIRVEIDPLLIAAKVPVLGGFIG